MQSWRGGGRWFTQQWQATHYVAENATLMFDPRTGMQGGEGMTTSGQWWIENVLEECDDVRAAPWGRVNCFCLALSTLAAWAACGAETSPWRSLRCACAGARVLL